MIDLLGGQIGAGVGAMLDGLWLTAGKNAEGGDPTPPYV
jgi:hypothetical protein